MLEGYGCVNEGGDDCMEAGGDGNVGLRMGTAWGETCGGGAFDALSQ